MKSEEFDQAFDDGEDVTSQLDMSAARRPGLEQRRVNVDFPVWMIESLDREARRLGVNRQSIIKVWLAERLERGVSPHEAPATRCRPAWSGSLADGIRDAKVKLPLGNKLVLATGGRTPCRKDVDLRDGGPSSGTVRACVGTWTAAPKGVGAEVPGPGRDQPHHRGRVKHRPMGQLADC